MNKERWLYANYTFDQEKRFKAIRKEIGQNQTLKELIFSKEQFNEFFMYSFYFAFMFAIIVPENYPLY